MFELQRRALLRSAVIVATAGATSALSIESRARGNPRPPSFSPLRVSSRRLTRSLRIGGRIPARPAAEGLASATAGFDVVQTVKFSPALVSQLASALASVARRPLIAAAGGYQFRQRDYLYTGACRYHCHVMALYGPPGGHHRADQAERVAAES